MGWHGNAMCTEYCNDYDQLNSINNICSVCMHVHIPRLKWF